MSRTSLTLQLCLLGICLSDWLLFIYLCFDSVFDVVMMGGLVLILYICLALFGAYFGEVLVSFDSYSGFETLSICILLSDIRFLIHVQELLYLAKHMCSYLCFFSLCEFWVSILTACTIVGLFQSSLSVSFPFGFLGYLHGGI